MDYHKVVIVPGPGIGVAPSRRRGRRRSSRGVSVILTLPGIGSSRSCHNTNGGPSRGDGRRTGRASLLFLAAISDALSSRSGCSSPAYLDVVMLSCKTRPHLDRCVMDSAHSLHFTVQMPSPLSSLTLSLPRAFTSHMCRSEFTCASVATAPVSERLLQRKVDTISSRCRNIQLSLLSK